MGKKLLTTKLQSDGTIPLGSNTLDETQSYIIASNIFLQGRANQYHIMAFSWSDSLKTNVLNIVLYRLIRAVCTGPPADRHVDHPLPGSIKYLDPYRAMRGCTDHNRSILTITKW